MQALKKRRDARQLPVEADILPVPHHQDADIGLHHIGLTGLEFEKQAGTVG